MKNHTTCCVLYGLFVAILTTNADGIEFCSWWPKHPSGLECERYDFPCSNGQKCIRRSLYCDYVVHCDDGSDERYCSLFASGTPSCPENFIECDIDKCVPSEWRCDAYKDCRDGGDEDNCQGIAYHRYEMRYVEYEKLAPVRKVENWIRAHLHKLSATKKWGFDVDRLALILYVSIRDFYDYCSFHKTELAYELNIQMLSQLSRKKLKDIPSEELTSYVNAFTVMCIHPRNFHGYDLIEELRDRVDQENYTNPHVLLALCIAGQTITESDKRKLMDTFWNKHRTDSTEMQAVAVMALACANKQPRNEVDPEKLRKMTLELKQQYNNGTVVNLQTAALVMQALIATDSESDPDNFDEVKAYQELLQNQKSDGSFGDITSTSLVTPVLTCKSLVNINSDRCHYKRKDKISALDSLSRRSGPKVRVQYSLWFDKENGLELDLVLRVPQNMSLYKVMETAAEIDPQFKFDYSLRNYKPYISTISGIRDDALTGKFWFLYVIQSEQPTLSNESPADIIPNDNDHYVMWYRRRTWVD